MCAMCVDAPAQASSYYYHPSDHHSPHHHPPHHHPSARYGVPWQYQQPAHYHFSHNIPLQHPYPHSYETAFLRPSSPGVPHTVAAHSQVPLMSKASNRQHRKRCFDYPTALITLMVWGFLMLSCVVLLFFSHMSVRQNSEEGALVSKNEVAATRAVSAMPILIATILNEVLMDRCWRRVVYSALGTNHHLLSNSELGKRLRAANFGWLNFTHRLFKGRISKQDIRAVASYTLLRWGTAISIASVQLCVSWKPVDPDLDDGIYNARKRNFWILGPALLHMCSVFGTMLIWLMPPWTFFSDRFHDPGLLEMYEPYLDRVRDGSIAKYQTVAEILDPITKKATDLAQTNKPGIQLSAKINGIWFGLIGMNVPPALAWAFFRFVSYNDILETRGYRFALHLIFLAQNILYLLALDFAVWNVSLEGFCKDARARSSNKSLRHLGYSSGIVLLVKAVQQRRPVRAAVFMWLFWLQACLVRSLTIFYAFCATIVSYGIHNDRKDFYDPLFWIGWLAITNAITLPLFVLWLFTRFQVPICEPDGWRWAKIAQNALHEPGYYGVRDGRAVWGADVKSFEDCKDQILL